MESVLCVFGFEKKKMRWGFVSKRVGYVVGFRNNYCSEGGSIESFLLFIHLFCFVFFSFLFFFRFSFFFFSCQETKREIDFS